MMEYEETPIPNNYNEVTETLMTMFGDGIDRDVLFTVVQSVDGDLNHAANILMNMMNDNNLTEQHNGEFRENQLVVPFSQNIESSESRQMGPLTSHPAPKSPTPSRTMSYSATASTVNNNTRISPRPPKRQINTPKHTFCCYEMTRILENHNKGSRILILMRGVPGSGKTYLAKNIIDCTVGKHPSFYKRHILSTDDYFMNGSVYQFDKTKLSYAHGWNQDRACAAVKCGISPIIIDNTNIELWEMKPYFEAGVRNGYIIEVVEPNTTWAKKAHILCKKNSHNVPFITIKRMLENCKTPVTADDLFSCFNCHYSASLYPPQIRNIPVFMRNEAIQTEPSVIEENDTAREKLDQIFLPHTETNIPHASTSTVDISVVNTISQSGTSNVDNVDNVDSTSNSIEDNNIAIIDTTLQNSGGSTPDEEFKEIDDEEICQDTMQRQLKYLNVSQQLEEMQKLENEWENGESWEEIKGQELETSTSTNQPSTSEITSESSYTEILATTTKQALEAAKNWSQISMFLPPWDLKSNQNISAETEDIVEMKSSSTCIDLGDTDLQNTKPEYKILIGKFRDINFGYVPKENEKIPKVRMLDKSTTTKEDKSFSTYRCKNAEQHFKKLLKIFKQYPEPLLRDIFDQCYGNINWAVDILLDSNGKDTLDDIDDGDDSDSDSNEDCTCVAAYDIIPDINTESEKLDAPLAVPTSIDNSPSLRKIKKETNKSEKLLNLKQEIEKIVVISESHYSKDCLKVKKTLHGETEVKRNLDDPIVKHSEIFEEKKDTKPPFPPLTSVPSTSKQDPITPPINSASSSSMIKLDKEEAEISDDESLESQPIETVPLKFNQHFLSQLDALFGKNDLSSYCNEEITIDMPLSLAYQIHALLMESLAYQLEQNDRQIAQMLKEDEEFARELDRKENEMATSEKEPEIPNFKEIMDMDMAISLYQKDIDEWRNSVPNDLAAKLTRDKLFNLFPEVNHEVLTELLLAHDNNFNATVEVLLVSTGRTDVLERKNGVNKFVVEKEMEIKKELLEKEKKDLDQKVWSLEEIAEDVDMDTVKGHRNVAMQHLLMRNRNYQMAQNYVSRGMLDVANYYSALANFHRTKYEHANSLAAVSLVQVNLKRYPNDVTLDLHYLHVNEAKEYVDIYIDSQIQKLKANLHRTGVRDLTLHLITGRGLHSLNGRPRLKPAVKKRLRERGIRYTENNPGFLNAMIDVDTLLSHLVPSST